ncbi:MAG: C40 family peptidase [Prevotella sp.]|nr:C40 family peptidase [Prevotella sp.]MDY5666934.1 C40 family peptidase [Alloprevotella sp.]
MIVQIKKYAACVALGVMSFFTANAQDIMPETIPTRPTAEKIVKEVAPVGALQQSTAVAENKVASVSYNANFGESVVQTALQYLGASYRSGMSGPYAFDCSGFTSYVYRQQNVSILRSSRSQYTQGTPIARIADLKKGDLVFFGGRGSLRSVGHVGIVMDVDPSGNNFSFVHAASGGVKVSDSNEAYYSRRYIGARRIVEN